MIQQPSQETVSILHELSLGQHMLFILSDNSIDLMENDEHTSHPLISSMHLDSEETYRLFISLCEQFQLQRKQEEGEITHTAERKITHGMISLHHTKAEVITAPSL